MRKCVGHTYLYALVKLLGLFIEQLGAVHDGKGDFGKGCNDRNRSFVAVESVCDECCDSLAICVLSSEHGLHIRVCAVREGLDQVVVTHNEVYVDDYLEVFFNGLFCACREHCHYVVHQGIDCSAGKRKLKLIGLHSLCHTSHKVGGKSCYKIVTADIIYGVGDSITGVSAGVLPVEAGFRYRHNICNDLDCTDTLVCHVHLFTVDLEGDHILVERLAAEIVDGGEQGVLGKIVKHFGVCGIHIACGVLVVTYKGFSYVHCNVTKSTDGEDHNTCDDHTLQKTYCRAEKRGDGTLAVADSAGKTGEKSVENKGYSFKYLEDSDKEKRGYNKRN